MDLEENVVCSSRTQLDRPTLTYMQLHSLAEDELRVVADPIVRYVLGNWFVENIPCESEEFVSFER